jgi:hypothetical protein
MRRNIAVALAAVPSALLLTAAPALASSSDGTVHLDAMKRRGGASAGRDVPRQSRGAHFDDEGGP